MVIEVDLLSLIEQRKNYPVVIKDMESELNYVSSVIDNADNWAALVIPSGFLLKRYGSVQVLKNIIFNDWFVSGIFDLSGIWQPYSSITFTLLLLEHERPKSVLFSLYTGNKTFSSRTNRTQPGVIGLQTIESEFLAYIKALETFIKTRIPTQALNTKFFSTDYHNLDLDRLHVNYYDPDLVELERKIRQETFVPLSQIAQIFTPRKKAGTACVLRPKDFRYPIDIQSLAQGSGTNIVLQQNDVVVTRDLSRAYLILDPLTVEVTPSLFTFVVRPNTEVVLPEYLCLYFQSDVAKDYSLRYQTGSVLPGLNIRDISNFPIILPDLTTARKSKNIFETLYLMPKAEIGDFNRIIFSPTNTEGKDIQKEFILEGLYKLKLIKQELVRHIVNEDLQELGQCLEFDLHKSCLILCGSVLEAILLDWLSEIEMVNYFEKANTPKLFDIINRLYNLNFLDEASKEQAHLIRDKRNLVHPKKYLGSGIHINRELCFEMVYNLKQVLAQRNLRPT